MKQEPRMETLIRVKVVPRSSRTEIMGRENGVYRVKLTAPPVEGKANQALIKFLSEQAGVPGKDVEIVSGKTGRLKVLRIRGLSEPAFAQALAAKTKGNEARGKARTP